MSHRVRVRGRGMLRLHAPRVALLLVLVMVGEVLVAQRWGPGANDLLFAVGADWLQRPWSLALNVLGHKNWPHVLVNAAGILVLGSVVERRVGTRAWWVVFLVVGNLAGLAQAYAGGQPALGASGAVLAFLGLAVWFGLDEVPGYQDLSDTALFVVLAGLSVLVVGAFAWDWWSQGPGGGRVAHAVGAAVGAGVGAGWTLRGREEEAAVAGS